MFNPSDMKEMLTNARQVGEEMQRKMEQTVVESSSGGGIVTARMNGKKQLLSIKIAASAVDPNDVEMLQDLVLAAVNEAGRKADAAMQSSVTGMLGGLGLPGLS
jgi:nucleoid-associated protein EbfC